MNKIDVDTGTVTCLHSGVTWRPEVKGQPLVMLVSEEVIERALQSVVYELQHTQSQAAHERCQQTIKDLGGSP